MQKLSERAIIHHFSSEMFTGVVGVEQSMSMPRPLFLLKRFWLVATQSCQTRYQSDPGLGYFCSTFWQKIKQISQSHNSTWSGLTRNIFFSSSWVHLTLPNFCLVSNNFVRTNQKIIKKVSKGKRKYYINTYQCYFLPNSYFSFSEQEKFHTFLFQ